MLEVHIPIKFSPEIKYTFEVLLGEFLGISHHFILSESNQNFILTFNSGKSIFIQNSFFHRYPEPQGYLVQEALPKDPTNWSDVSLGMECLPILYGTTMLHENENELNLEADIIASSFFMLSRWEEIIDPITDEHDRSTADQSIAFKYNFLHRPIVNEYADLLWNILKRAGYPGDRKKHTYKAVVTHDLDQPYQWPDWWTSCKHLAGDLIVRNDLKLAFKNLVSLYNTKFLGKQDPFDHLQYLLDLANEEGYQAFFNIIVSKRSRHDFSLSLKDPRLKSILHRIESNGHVIGYHPGYTVYKDVDVFKKELDQLQTVVKQKIVSGRQHYLRFKVPYTWRLWDQAGLEWESSLGYTKVPGFRCGTCYTYTVFDSIARKKLTVKEKPLILMDATLVYYLKHWEPSVLLALKQSCKKHGGEWVTIWHNDLVKHELLKGYQSLVLN